MDHKFFLNERIMDLFADSLRMVNDEALLDTYELEDVEEIYEILVGLYPDNLQYQEDLISFVYNILDDEDRTILLIEKVMIASTIKEII